MKILDDNTPQPVENKEEAPGMKPEKVRAYTILFGDFEGGLRDIGTDNPDNINAFEILGAFEYLGNMIKAALTKEPPVNVYENLAKSLGLKQVDGKNNWIDLDGVYYKQTKLGFKPTSIIKE